ncbi:MAG TPA: M1 family metallopeptidase [Longimicrobium sp.]
MKRWSPTLVGALIALGAAAPVQAQQPAQTATVRRPVPNPVMVPREFQRATARGTRTTTGAPGTRYWQQRADYRIRATVDAAARTLTGSETITYHNRSPDTLRVVWLQLMQNVHQAEAPRNEPAEVTGGYRFTRVAAGGQAVQPAEDLRSGSGYAVDFTRMAIRPASPLLPGDSLRLELDWSYKIPQAGAGARMGHSRDNLLYLAYWYPQMAVYDDVVGWQTDPFLGGAEFYMPFGRYEYTVDAPEGWVVMGTGTLANAESVLPADVLQRWRRAAQSDTTVHVLAAGSFGAGKATQRGANGRLQWTFRADSVRDVAFSVTRESNWDAARTPVGDRNGDGRTDYALIQSFWRSTAPRWAHSVKYSQQSITHHGQFTGIPYPYPHMTAVEGEDIMGGGMEYPMMTLIGPYTAQGDTALYNVTSHELGHMWFPMIVGVDERRYGWMDEGTTNFNENEAHNDFFRGAPNAHLREQQQYVNFVRNVGDPELLRWTDLQEPNLGGFATYTKPATLLHALRGVLGEETFLRTYRNYARTWAFKHPKPWDFFNAFNAGAGRNLDWFWSTWYAEAWSLDQAIAGVVDEGGNTTIAVEDRGSAPMPARLLITRQNGSTERREVPVETWLSGARTARVTVPAAGSPVVRVEIDPTMSFPDVDRSNNVWTR